jgi:TolB-like protein
VGVDEREARRPPAAAVRFGEFRLDPARAELTRSGQPIALRPKTYALLKLFVASPGRVLGKDELVAALWPKAVVAEGSLSQCVAELREALGERGATLIKTVARQGYRFDAAVQAEPAPLLAQDKPSIAVLPFQNLSGDPEQEYFADGLAQEIITALSRLRSLFVIARNSSFVCKGRAVDVKQVGQELGVRYLLEGSVRNAGSRVRITGRLVDATTGAHIWADRFDGDLEDIFDLQDRITASVVGAIWQRFRGPADAGTKVCGEIARAVSGPAAFQSQGRRRPLPTGRGRREVHRRTPLGGVAGLTLRADLRAGLFQLVGSCRVVAALEHARLDRRESPHRLHLGVYDHSVVLSRARDVLPVPLSVPHRHPHHGLVAVRVEEQAIAFVRVLVAEIGARAFAAEGGVIEEGPGSVRHVLTREIEAERDVRLGQDDGFAGAGEARPVGELAFLGQLRGDCRCGEDRQGSRQRDVHEKRFHAELGVHLSPSKSGVEETRPRLGVMDVLGAADCAGQGLDLSSKLVKA